MRNFIKPYTIKIPEHITVLYCNKKKIITIIGPLARKSLRLEIDVEIVKTKKFIRLIPNQLTKMSNSKKRKQYSLQKTTVSLIKQLLLETSYILYKKLKLVGVGYRVFDVGNFEKKLLGLRLGYSHSIYFKIPKKSEIFCLKRTKLFIYGNSYQNITQTASIIRSYKKPEPYKGKGILYENEKIILKEGKKV